MRQKPRLPTEAELQDISIAGAPSSEPLDIAEQRDLLDNACVAVFDKYISDGPGYAGKVATVVWSGGPEITSSFVWRESGCEQVAATG